jgi:hypothetical protein
MSFVKGEGFKELITDDKVNIILKKVKEMDGT